METQPPHNATEGNAADATPSKLTAEERTLWDAYWSACGAKRALKTTEQIAARNALVEHYLPLVQIIAHKVSRTRSIDPEELLVPAVLRLMNMIPRYCETHATKPITYFSVGCRGAMLDHCRDVDTLSRTNRTRAKNVERWEQMELGRPATKDETYEHFGYVVTEPRVVSINAPCEPHSKHCLADVLLDPDADRDHSLAATSEILRGLDARERLIMLLYHVEGLSMREVGRSLGISESRVSQKMTEILTRLRTPENRQRLVA